MKEENDIATTILDACFEVHRILGPGLLESIYEKCLLHELKLRGIKAQSQRNLSVTYKDLILEDGYRLDIWINEKVIVELKAVEALNDIHLAQMLTYLKLTKNRLGLLINFNVPLMKNGIKRVINHPNYHEAI